MPLIKGLMMLVASAAIVTIVPQEALARNVVSYVLFEFTGADTLEKLRSTSLGNCLKIPIGSGDSSEVILHLRCSENNGSSTNKYLNQAVVELSQVQGVRRATVLIVRTEGQ
jgi:hypothetical protein